MRQMTIYRKSFEAMPPSPPSPRSILIIHLYAFGGEQEIALGCQCSSNACAFQRKRTKMHGTGLRGGGCITRCDFSLYDEGVPLNETLWTVSVDGA